MWTKTYKVVGFLEPGVVKFGDKNLMIYISKETIDRYSHRLKGKPVTIGHIEGITEENAQKVSVGDVAVCPEPGECIVTIKNEEADRLIESGDRFSCCWVPVKWGPGGTWHNIPYDRELVEMDFTHLAIVPDPRYENVEVFMNSKEYKNETFRPRSDDAGPGFSRAAASSQIKVARKAEPTTYNVSTFTEQPRQHKSIGERKVVKMSSFKNSLNPGQYAFLKKYVKEYNNAKVDEGLSVGQKREARMQRNTNMHTKPQNTVNNRINYRQSVRDFMPKGLHPQQNKALIKEGFSNEVNPPDNSVERMDRINKYLQKREDRRIDKQYKTYVEPKQYADRYSEHFNRKKGKAMFRYKDGREFNNECMRKRVREYNNAQFKVPANKVKKPDWYGTQQSNRMYDMSDKLSGNYSQFTAGDLKYPGVKDGAVKLKKDFSNN